MNPSLLALAVSGAALLAPSPAPAAGANDWPEFRGPTGQGTLKTDALPLSWDGTKNVAWKQEVPGGGWSSPVLVAGRVYLTAAVPEGGDVSLRALCLDAGTGKVLWNKEALRQDSTGRRIHNKNSHASPTPIVHGKRLYVHFGHRGTACLDLDGKVLWTNTSLRYEPVHGNGGSPALVDGRLVFSCDGGDERFVVALDADTGKQLWRTARSVESDRGFSFSTPLVIAVGGKKQVISPGSDMVGAYDPATGKELWRVRYAGGYSVIPRPVFAHGLVFVCTGFPLPSLLAIRPDGAGDVTDTHVKWKSNQRVPYTPSVVLDGDELYMVSDRGLASCLDARTGKVHWSQRVGGSHSASPLLAAGRLYLQAEDGTGSVLRAGKEFKLLATNPLKERTLASYAAADGALFIRTAKHLYRIQAR
jgi:outer membrane protein assembly factor BamB